MGLRIILVLSKIVENLAFARNKMASKGVRLPIFLALVKS